METQRAMFNILKHISYYPMKVSATCHKIHNCYVLHTHYIFIFRMVFEKKIHCYRNCISLTKFQKQLFLCEEGTSFLVLFTRINLLKPTGHVMHQQFNIQQLYVLPTLYLCVLHLSENKQRLVPLTAETDWFL